MVLRSTNVFLCIADPFFCTKPSSSCCRMELREHIYLSGVTLLTHLPPTDDPPPPNTHTRARAQTPLLLGLFFHQLLLLPAVFCGAPTPSTGRWRLRGHVAACWMAGDGAPRQENAAIEFLFMVHCKKKTAIASLSPEREAGISHMCT